MFGTYHTDDVTVLLKDITGRIEPLDTAERERRIQSGVHYSEMLPIEYEPNSEYMDAFRWAMENYCGLVADAVAHLANRIIEARGCEVVLVSLARAGTSAGILLRRYMRRFASVDPPHYTVSIIRGIGIDDNAMRYILASHAPECIQFVDGWTGKGAILGQLREAMRGYSGVSPELAVIADPAHIAESAGTREDLLIPSSCLNATVCGLLSRTVLRNDLIGPDDYHGAVFYEHLKESDLTYAYVDAVESLFRPVVQDAGSAGGSAGSFAKPTSEQEVAKIAQEFQVSDRNLIKPGIGEATRVLLRRLPWKILVHSLHDTRALGHLYRLAHEKKVELVEYPLLNYKACGIIRQISDA